MMETTIIGAPKLNKISIKLTKLTQRLARSLGDSVAPVPAPFVPPPMVDGPVPAGWDVLNSGATGDVYYVNTVTGTAQKEFPSESALPNGWDMVHSETTGASEKTLSAD